ncbi:MAG: SDR family NAD(P)-dependent oxidoreductase, partial [Gammaproteobacteria bacterium]
MTDPVILDETIEVSRPLHEAFAYLADFSRIEEWDPAVERAARLTEGPSGVGTEYRIDMKAGFSLHYRVVEFEPDARIRMTVDSRFFTANEEIRFRGVGARTRVRYIAKFDFPAPIAVVSRSFPGIMDRVGKSAMGGLKSALEDAFDPPGASPWIAAADRLVLPGLWRFTRLGYCAARRHWRPISAYLGEKRMVVTGATSGIGRAATEELARRGAGLVLVARDEVRARHLVEELKERTGNGSIEYEIADLSLMADVHALCDRLLADGRPIDVLINNAGALFNPRQVTPEGLEKSFALLLLGPSILTERLHPLLQQTGAARVVNVLSGGMYTQKIHVDDLQSEHGAYSGAVAYARAKRGLMILTEEWAGRWRDDGIA